MILFGKALPQLLHLSLLVKYYQKLGTGFVFVFLSGYIEGI